LLAAHSGYHGGTGQVLGTDLNCSESRRWPAPQGAFFVSLCIGGRTARLEHRTTRQVRRWSVGHDAPRSPRVRRGKSRPAFPGVGALTSSDAQDYLSNVRTTVKNANSFFAIHLHPATVELCRFKCRAASNADGSRGAVA
jgi:hypothetical protein